MRPIHTTQTTSPSMPTGSGLGTGINPYGSLVMGSLSCDHGMAPLSVSNNQDVLPNAPPVYFMPSQNHLNVVTPSGKVTHPPPNMFYHEQQQQPQQQQSLSGYIAQAPGASTSLPVPTVNQHRNDFHSLHLGSDLFSYFSNQPLRTMPEMRSTPLSTMDQVHPPAVQRGPTVYIGHLTPDTDDVIIRQLLQECGRVLRWSRTTDPATKKLSSFGFCEFESPLGVTRAVRCLNGLILDGQALVANCEDKVKEGMEQWRNDRKNKLQEENPAKSIQEIEHEIEKEELRTTATTQRIAAEWNAKSAYQRLTEIGQKTESPTIPQPPAPTAPCEPEDQMLVEPLTKANAESKPSTPLPQRVQFLNALPGYVDIPSHVTLSNRESIRVRQWNSAIKDARAHFRKYCQAWERKEQYLRKDRLKAQDETKTSLENPSKMSSLQKKHLIEKDLQDLLYYIAPNGTIWEGPLSSRQTEERSIWLKKERERDDQDRLDELKELQKIAKNAALEAAQVAFLKASKNEEEHLIQIDQDSHRNTEENDLKITAAEYNDSCPTQDETVKNNTVITEENSGQEKPIQLDEKASHGLSSQTHMSSPSKAQESTPTPTETVYPKQTFFESIPAVLDLQLAPLKKTQSIREKRITSSVSNVFNIGDDDDDENEGDTFKSRDKRPLPPLSDPSNLVKRNTDLPASLQSEQKRQELVKRLAAQIPQTTEELFLFPIDWNLLKANKIFETKVTPWINKKIVEFLGEEEPELTILLSTKIMMEPEPNTFLEKLKEFFDEDAKGFTVKLWKMLVFEVLRLRQSGSV